MLPQCGLLWTRKPYPELPLFAKYDHFCKIYCFFHQNKENIINSSFKRVEGIPSFPQIRRKAVKMMKKGILGLVAGAVCLGALTFGGIQTTPICYAEETAAAEQQEQGNQMEAASAQFYTQWKAEDGTIYDPTVTQAQIMEVYKLDDNMAVFRVKDSAAAKEFYAYIMKGKEMYWYEQLDKGNPYMYFTRIE